MRSSVRADSALAATETTPVCQTMNMSAEPPFDDHAQGGDAPISLVSPSEEYIDSFFQAMAEFAAEGIPQISASMNRDEFPTYVQRLHDQAVGRNLKEGHVPSKEFWIIDAEGYAGRIFSSRFYLCSRSSWPPRWLRGTAEQASKGVRNQSSSIFT